MLARRAAVRHCEANSRERLPCEENRERLGSCSSARERCNSDAGSRGELGGSGEYQRCSSPQMGNNTNHLRPDGNIPSVQINDGEELSQERLTNSSFSYTYGAPPQIENQMKRDLKYFFMNPYEKYIARGRKPWKLCIQILKIFLVTTQLILFGTNQFSIVTFMEENRKAFEHIFLKEWDSAYDSGVYPSTKSLYAVYQIDSFFGHVDHVVEQYSNLSNVALGTYILPIESERVIQVDVKEYQEFDVSKDQTYYNLDLHVKYTIYHINITDNITEFHFRDFLKEEYNTTLNFDRIEAMQLSFEIDGVHVNDASSEIAPECVVFHVKVDYDNTPHSGRVGVGLSQVHDIDKACSEKTMKKSSGLKSGNWKSWIINIMDFTIIVLCAFSSVLCSRSLVTGHQLRKKTVNFFQRYYHQSLTRSEKIEFLNLWYVIIIVSDVLTLAGTTAKILIKEQKWSDYDAVSLLLGCGCFLVWFGIIRYLGFFHSYSIPIITLKCAMPNVLRFLLCASIMYLAYAFCGWVVLGPYHKKFRTMGITLACMFSLINGDDMFATFRAMSEISPLIYYFSQVYLYTFISLFIYVVLSLFIAVIMDTYETVKEMRDRGGCENELQRFYRQCEESPDSGCFRVHREPSVTEFFNGCCKRLCCHARSDSDENTPLMS